MATNVAELRLGDLLVREGLIDAEQLSAALQDAKDGGTRVGYSLVKLGFVGENELTRMLSKQYHLPAVDLEKVEDGRGDERIRQEADVYRSPTGARRREKQH